VPRELMRPSREPGRDPGLDLGLDPGPSKSNGMYGFGGVRGGVREEPLSPRETGRSNKEVVGDGGARGSTRKF